VSRKKKFGKWLRKHSPAWFIGLFILGLSIGIPVVNSGLGLYSYFKTLIWWQVFLGVVGVAFVGLLIEKFIKENF